MLNRRSPRTHRPITFPINGREVLIFSPHGEPYGHLLRQAILVIKRTTDDSEARRLLYRIVNAMNKANGVRTYRNVVSVIEPNSWIDIQFVERLENLGFAFTQAVWDRQYESFVGTVKASGGKITYVHKRSGEKIKHGERVIVPSFPSGRRLYGGRREGWSVRLYKLQPTRRRLAS